MLQDALEIVDVAAKECFVVGGGENEDAKPQDIAPTNCGVSNYSHGTTMCLIWVLDAQLVQSVEILTASETGESNRRR